MKKLRTNSFKSVQNQNKLGEGQNKTSANLKKKEVG